ncbi:hypothetical protein WJX73_009957 [Symbiochloris irregularis]|uniref:Coenzyme Q-binding protein COQ10 START domain-containing protein n=1 Tax=Symbiochloris irregularis TaxID=706552 RepID=A0AAW1P8M8_9CHLO
MLEESHVSTSSEESSELDKQEGTEVKVTQRDGFLCKVWLKTHVKFPASRVFDVLAQPDNSHIFRSIKAITYRKVLEDDHKGKQRCEIEHEAEWKFLMFGGRFRTRLYVSQDRQAGKLDFQLAEPGMMKNFEGKWSIKPAQSPAEQSALKPPRWLHLPQWASREAGDDNEATCLELEQSVCPNVIPPPPLDRLLKGIAKKQVLNVVEDLRKEIDRIKKEEAKAKQKA